MQPLMPAGAAQRMNVFTVANFPMKLTWNSVFAVAPGTK